MAKLRLAAIIESSTDAIIGKALDGTITDWNAGAEQVFGYTADEMIGQSILTLIPPDRRSEEDEIVARLRRGERLKHFETVRRHKDGTLIDVSLTVSPILDAAGHTIGASKIARDISERKAAEAMIARQSERLATLNRVAAIISRDLDLERIVQAVTDIATELTGARFGAFFYNVHDAKGEAYQLYTLSGVPREAFDGFAMPRNTAVFAPTFSGAGVVRSDDIRQDPRYGHNAPNAGMPKGHLPVVSYLAVPVIAASGEVLGGLFFAHDAPGQFSADIESLVVAIAAQTAVAMDNARLHKAARLEIQQRQRAEEAKELLLHELQHRVKNTLAMIQALATRTFRTAQPEELETFVARLLALSGAHDLLSRQEWSGTEVGEMIGLALRPFDDPLESRIAIAGPAAPVTADNALQLALVFHELATNAIKYGALSEPEGRVAVSWEFLPEGVLQLNWAESQGPTVTPPTHRGFGTRMIERALRGKGSGASFDFAPAGLQVTLRLDSRR